MFLAGTIDILSCNNWYSQLEQQRNPIAEIGAKEQVQLGKKQLLVQE